MYLPEAFPSAYPGTKLLSLAPAQLLLRVGFTEDAISYGGGFRIQADIGQYFFGILIPSEENQDLIHIIKP